MKHEGAVALAMCLLERRPEAGFMPRLPAIRFIESLEHERDPHALPAGALETHQGRDGRKLVTRLAIVTLIVNDGADDTEREKWRKRYEFAYSVLVAKRQRAAEIEHLPIDHRDILHYNNLIDCRDEGAGAMLVKPAGDWDWWTHFTDHDAILAARGHRGARGYQELQAAVKAAFEAGKPLPHALRLFVEHILESGLPRNRRLASPFDAAMAECVSILQAQNLTQDAALYATSEAAKNLKAAGLFRGRRSLETPALAKRLPKAANHK